MARPGELSLLRSTRLSGSAFELYLDADTAVVLVNDRVEHVWEDMVGGYAYRRWCMNPPAGLDGKLTAS